MVGVDPGPLDRTLLPAYFCNCVSIGPLLWRYQSAFGYLIIGMPQGVGQAVCCRNAGKADADLSLPKLLGAFFWPLFGPLGFLGNSVVIRTAEHWPIQGMGVMDILGYQGQNDDHEGGFRCHIYRKLRAILNLNHEAYKRTIMQPDASGRFSKRWSKGGNEIDLLLAMQDDLFSVPCNCNQVRKNPR